MKARSYVADILISDRAEIFKLLASLPQEIIKPWMKAYKDFAAAMKEIYTDVPARNEVI